MEADSTPAEEMKAVGGAEADDRPASVPELNPEGDGRAAGDVAPARYGPVPCRDRDLFGSVHGGGLVLRPGPRRRSRWHQP